MKHDLTELLDEAEAKYRLSHVSSDPQARSTACAPTGLLGVDLMLGGGIFPGLWYTIYGGEGSAKSTLLTQTLFSFARLGISGQHYDFEGCVTCDVSVTTQHGETKAISLVSHIDNPQPGEWYSAIPNTQLLTAGGMGDVVRIGYKGEKPVHRLRTEKGRTLTGYAHPVLTLRDGCLVYVNMEDVLVGDEVVTRAD